MCLNFPLLAKKKNYFARRRKQLLKRIRGAVNGGRSCPLINEANFTLENYLCLVYHHNREPDMAAKSAAYLLLGCMSAKYYMRFGSVAVFQAMMSAFMLYFDSITRYKVAIFFVICGFLVPFVALVLIGYGMPLFTSLKRLKRICALALISLLLTFGAFQVWVMVGVIIQVFIGGYI